MAVRFPKIMAIINSTPDSFSDGGVYSLSELTEKALKEIEDGADILDIGGESSRPGALPVPIEEEINRTIPLIQSIRKHNKDIPISLDTTKSQVAAEAIKYNIQIINDISGLRNDIELGKFAAENNLEYIIMHMKGEPRNMQLNPVYSNLLEEIYSFLLNQINLAKNLGIKKIYIDVGIGFGKTYEHNIELLKNLEYFNSLGYPMLLGISRKSFIGKMLNIEDPKLRDFPTAIIHSLLLNKKIEIIRVHNSKLHYQLKKIFEEIIS